MEGSREKDVQGEGAPGASPSEASLAATAPARESATSHTDVDGSTPPRERGAVRGTIEVLTRIIAPVTLITALLFYFGYVRTASVWLAFGVDPSVLELSVNDYLLRSVRSVFWPLAILLAFGLGASWGHAIVTSWIARGGGGHRAQPVALSCVAIGCASIAIGMIRFLTGVSTSYEALTIPILFTVGVVFSSYGIFLWPRSARLARHSTGLRDVHIGISIALVVLGIFWSIGAYAQIVGQQQARRLASDIGLLPRIVVYSERRLELHGAGITESTLSRSDSAYHFRYSGLLMLIRSNDTYFLLPKGWTPEEGFAISLAESPTVRLEFDLDR
jgi:hypothetical protein